MAAHLALADIAISYAAVYDGYCREIVKNYAIKPDGTYRILGAKFKFNFKSFRPENKLNDVQLYYIGARLCEHFSKFVTPEIKELDFYRRSEQDLEKQFVQIYFGQKIDYPFVMEAPLIEFWKTNFFLFKKRTLKNATSMGSIS